MRTVEWRDGVVRMIDQRRLPNQFIVAEYSDYHAVAQAIRDMVVRGAPAIGATAAFALALAAQHSPAQAREALLADLAAAAAVIRQARPTAANLNWGLDRLLRHADPEIRAAALRARTLVAPDTLRRLAAMGSVAIQSPGSTPRPGWGLALMG